jgi:quinol monooxygenase YgiN
MSDIIHAMGRVVARLGQADELERALRNVVLETRKEPGNIHFDLYRVAADDSTFVLEESWRSAEALHLHVDSPHVKALFARGEELAEGPFTLTPLTPIDVV